MSKAGERSSGELSHGRSEDKELSGSVGNDPPIDWATWSDEHGRDHREENSAPNDWAAFCELQGRVQRDGVGQLQGTQVGKAFCDKLDKLVDAGEFDSGKAEYLKNGVTMGFDLGLDESVLKGKRVFKNYPTAFSAKDKVTDALRDRVRSGKTLKLGAFDGNASKLPGKDATVVPMGSVGKKLEPTKVRPFSDHTKTRLNKAARDRVEHTLDTYDEIAEALKPSYFARIEDVDAAFPILPLHPRVWNHMLIWWYDVDRPLEEQDGPNTLYCHIFADFGTAPLPGIWDLFWKAIKAMAKHDGVLTLPMPHFVDDNTLIGPSAEEVDAVGEALSDYVEELGAPFKRLKTRKASMRQLVLGFWWDSVARTRKLEDEKLKIYIDYLLEMASRRSVTLSELRVLLGRMHRASMTMPGGAKAFLGNILSMIRGLKMPWHQRRMTAKARKDILKLVEILQSNHGQGYFDTSHLPWHPAIWTDAMKNDSGAAWGWCCADGEYDYGRYQRRKDVRKFIDELEGNAVERALKAIGEKARDKRVPIYIDNSSFQLSLVKGWSKAERLTEVIKQLYALSVEYNCVIVPIWISTHDNVGADALSRGDLGRFHEWAKDHMSNQPYQHCH